MPVKDHAVKLLGFILFSSFPFHVSLISEGDFQGGNLITILLPHCQPGCPTCKESSSTIFF